MRTVPLWTDVVLAWASVATGLILLIAGGIAWLQASEARKLRRAQARPFVIIDLDMLDHPFIHLRIWNSGATMARNVHFEISPPIASTMDSDERKVRDSPILKDGILSLPPGKEIRFLLDSGPARKATELPDRYDVTITYEGEKVPRLIRKARREPFKDETTLDLSIYWNLTFIIRHGVHDIHKRLKEIKDLMKRWSASGSGLLAVSPADVRRRDEEWLAQEREASQPSPPDSEEA